MKPAPMKKKPEETGGPSRLVEKYSRRNGCCESNASPPLGPGAATKRLRNRTANREQRGKTKGVLIMKVLLVT